MAKSILQQIREAVANLNPQDVRNTAERPLAVRLVASSPAGYAAIEQFLVPPEASPAKRGQQMKILHRAEDFPPAGHFDLEICEAGLPHGPHAFAFLSDNPDQTIAEILERRDDLGLALARHFPPFRQAVVERVISSVAKENAMFAIATALPNIAPGLIHLPWAVAELGSDTAFLTVNQIRMLFLLAAASDRPVGYREQRAEIASVIAGAFGWRALARELVGKIPFGGGIVPKAAVAYAGTYVVGKSAERLYRIGYGFTRQERRQAYQDAFERGKQLARSLLRSREAA